MTENFSWIPIYQEPADQLAGWQGRQGELMAFLEKLRAGVNALRELQSADGEGLSALTLSPYGTLSMLRPQGDAFR